MALTETVVTAVKDLGPAIRERARTTETERTVPQESIDGLVEAGVARLLVPGEHGGSDGSLDAWFDISVEVASACASTGWCASLLTHLAHVLGMWPEEAQADVWASGPDVPLALSVAPTATVRPVDGGYHISGASPFASGVAHSQRVAVGGLVPTDDGPDWRWFIVPPDAYRVKDVWDTAAMRGTGSNVILTDDVFVPETHAVRVVEVREGTAPGGRSNADPKYRLPFASYSGLFATSVMLGAARGAFEHFLTWMTERRTPTGDRLAETAASQTGAARIAARLDASELMQRRVIDATRSPDVADLEQRARVVADLTFAGELVVQAVDEIMAMSGTAAFSLDNPVQRAWRDIHMAAAHISINPHLNLAHRGRMLLGVSLDPKPAVF